jgi:hypothetical protein
LAGIAAGSENLVKAVVGYQAQTTYQCRQFADLFMVPGNATEQDVAECKTDNPYHDQSGSAINGIQNGLRFPVMLQYKDKFYLESDAPGETRIKPITAGELKQHDRQHYPNFGMAFYNRALQFGLGQYMSRPQDLFGEERQFDGWLTFISNLP